MFIGTSEARLFRLLSDGLESVEAFDRAEGRDAWHTPWGGPPDTRSMSEWDADVYVNVHVGGILRTDDRGASSAPTIDIDADVHQVTTAEGLVLAACARGIASSTETLLVSASQGPRGGRSAVYRGGVATGVFERCRDGLPDRFDDNIDSHCLDALPRRLARGVRNFGRSRVRLDGRRCELGRDRIGAPGDPSRTRVAFVRRGANASRSTRHSSDAARQ